ncbi:hypothetical protein FPZ54_12055 [Sphingomonas suaedae]|uniref:Uncharacterized protein n=1 Tax=Sphingomonas suaedae TaxID=2599297 RepID=A0A518RGX0_9SPHN|nr:hypothetical protein [Sphingomonas suaedae]QDX26674.1 hypothetical protein FPZ54_12055 [Sphingomonas suaedae]
MKPNLDNPDYARLAWGRYRRIFGIVAAAALASAVIAVVTLYVAIGEFQLHASIAMAIGIGLSVLLGGALMGLVFLSSGTGHDERARDATEKKSD